jgi:thiamine-phosphate pyrophosphorylase
MVMMKPIAECRLYGILDTGYVGANSMAGMARSLIEGGIDILQLRAKRETPDAILAMSREVAPLCRNAGIPFILNDYPSLVGDAGADGTHIGQEDMSVAEARVLAGPGALIGKSTHSLEQALASAAESPDYLGFGPLFASPTKPEYAPIGTADIAAVNGRVGLPVFCIGGIKESNLRDVIAKGAERVVIVSDLLLAAEPTEKTAACKAMLTA